MKKLSLYIIPLLLLAACQSDDEPRMQQPANITFGTAGSGVGLEWEIGRGITRADGEIPGEIPEEIGVFAYYNKSIEQEVFSNQKVLYFYSTEYATNQFQWDYWDRNTGQGISAWPYTITPGSSKQKPWEKQTYRFLAYSPWSADGASVSANGYNFNTLSWANIPEYSDRDHLVAKRIVNVDNSAGTLGTADLVTFDMQHLMARIRFIFKMNENYRNIRRIVINSVSVQSGGKTNSVTITYKADGSLNQINWGGLTDGTPTTVTLVKETNEEYDVKTDFAEATSFGSLYVLPQTGFGELTLTVNYSTYDSAGKKTRDAAVTNTVILADPWDLIAGKYYDLKISIVPHYLYVLSDNDQDFDGWVIIKEPSAPAETKRK